MNKYFKIMLSLYFSFALTMIHAQQEKMPFQTESGTIIYEITGGAELTPETNLTIKGTAQLRFKDWGKIKIEEESGVALTTGAIRHKQNVQKFVKKTQDNIITVDYTNEQLTERKRASTQDDKNQTEGLAYKGKSNVAGVECDVWESIGVSKCIYKGIILQIESHVYNAHYIKKATKAEFNIYHSIDDFTLPDYPIHKIGLMKDHAKTKNIHKAASFIKVIKNKPILTKQKENQKIQQFLNDLGKDIFEQQKKILPVLLLSMRKARECIQTVEDPFEANQCIEDFSRMKKQLGTGENDYIILWDEKHKEILLDKIEDDITKLQASMPCINRAKNITDLSVCLKSE